MHIRFKLDPTSNHVRLPVHVNDQGPFWFTLDTGAVATSISSALAQRLKVRTRTEAQPRKYEVSIPSREAQLDQLRIGTQRFEKEDVLVVDFPKLLGACGDEVRGVIGHSTLRQFRMSVNYGTQVLTLEKPSDNRTRENPAIAWTPFEYIGNTHLVGVPVSVNGRGPFRFVLDTGAGATVITPNLAKQLNLQGDGCEGECRGVGGATQGQLVEVDSLSVGTTTVEKSSAAIVDLSAVTRRCHLIQDGIVGYTFLKDFELVLDYPNRRFALLNVRVSLPTGSRQQQQAGLCCRGPATASRRRTTEPHKATGVNLF